jgi:propanol-preferring alcohol dehydrogenase
MKAAMARLIGSPLDVCEVPTPSAGVGEVVVEIAACGVCYTDVKALDGLARRFPIIPGHEPVGRVHQVGDGVTAFSVGDRVAVHSYFTCGECENCACGEEQACERGGTLAGVAVDGGYAEFLAAPAAHVVTLPDALTFAEAAPLLCAGLTTYSGLRIAGVAPEQRVVIVGIGGLGHLAISIAAAMGCAVYAVTTSKDKATDARRRGAVFVGSADEVAERLRLDGGAHILLNTVDDLTQVGRLVPAMAKRGTVVLAAGHGTAVPVSLDQFRTLQLRVIGTFFGSTRDLRDLLELAVRHVIVPQIERYRLNKANSALDRLRRNEVRYRAVIEFGAG